MLVVDDGGGDGGFSLLAISDFWLVCGVPVRNQQVLIELLKIVQITYG